MNYTDAPWQKALFDHIKSLGVTTIKFPEPLWPRTHKIHQVEISVVDGDFKEAEFLLGLAHKFKVTENIMSNVPIGFIQVRNVNYQALLTKRLRGRWKTLYETVKYLTLK